MPNSTTQPVIKKALGEHWELLSDVIKKHYDITPGDNTSLTLHGEMSEVYHSKIAKLFLLPGRIFGALVPYQGKNIPTVVKNWTSGRNDKAMFWYRTLHFPNKSPVIFQSRMEHLADNQIIEYVKYGMGIRMALFEADNSLVFKSIGYVWKIGALTIPIPNWMILGDAVIVEKAISEEALHLDFEIVHPVFGKTFSYTGIFSILER